MRPDFDNVVVDLQIVESLLQRKLYGGVRHNPVLGRHFDQNKKKAPSVVAAAEIREGESEREGEGEGEGGREGERARERKRGGESGRERES